jgi:hypothetical protein
MLTCTRLFYRDLSCTWMCLDNRTLSWSGRVYITWGLLDVSTLQRRMLHLAVYTIGCVNTEQAFDAPGRILQRSVLHLDVATPQGPVLNLGLPGVVCTTKACADPGRVYTTGPELHLHECVWTTEAFAAPRRVYTIEDYADLYAPILQGPELHLDVSILLYMNAPGCVHTT